MVTLESGVLEDREVLDELARLREEGLAIGLTVTGPRQADTIERALEVGRLDSALEREHVCEVAARLG